MEETKRCGCVIQMSTAIVNEKGEDTIVSMIRENTLPVVLRNLSIKYKDYIPEGDWEYRGKEHPVDKDGNPDMERWSFVFNITFRKLQVMDGLHVDTSFMA